MQNTIVVKNLPIRLILANREISDILVKNLEIDKTQADSVTKLIIAKTDELMRMDGFGRKDNLVEQIAEILQTK